MSVKLSEVCELITDGDHQAPPKSTDGVPFITISCLDPNGGKIDFSNANYVPESYFEGLKNDRKIRQGDVLLSVVGSLGIPYLVSANDKFVFQRHIALLRPSEIILPEFLYYTCMSSNFFNQVDAIAQGAAQRTLTLTQLRNIEIELPTVSEQKRIAGILSTYDKLIENNRKQIALLEEAAQRLYKEWFIDLKFPGHENTPIIDGLPEDWKYVPMNDVMEKISTGLNPRKNFVLGRGNNFYVTIKNMADNSIRLDDKCDKVDDEALEKINKRSDLRTGDILFSGIGTMGRVYLIDVPTDNWNVSESVFVMRTDTRVSKALHYLTLLSNSMKSYCNQHAHGVAQRGIRMADLKSYPFLLPDQGTQEAFSNLAQPLIDEAGLLRRNCTALSEARNRLLPKLMSGEIEV